MTLRDDAAMNAAAAGPEKELGPASIHRGKHSERAARLIARFGQKLGIPADGLALLRQGMLLHDIGKTQIPESIHNKRGPLTQDEWKVMKRHPELGYQIASRDGCPPEVTEIIHYHHENWDGTGYPTGLCGEAIPYYARIAAIVEVWDALLHYLPYRPAWKKEDALAYVKEQAGQKFDPQLVAVFVAVVGEE